MDDRGRAMAREQAPQRGLVEYVGSYVLGRRGGRGDRARGQIDQQQMIEFGCQTPGQLAGQIASSACDQAGSAHGDCVSSVRSTVRSRADPSRVMETL
jgi:hypothetical protein